MKKNKYFYAFPLLKAVLCVAVCKEPGGGLEAENTK
jgi:hypothetical protein